ncbi:Hypothetical_protein [Hexamita inflata]|uniref:Hypothetical_protein n=1 Tax=Hexamita inflata TaxID=28002 RepID=A0AA86UTX2_9EUKA|nr:Hypothetical protein HINF_LOCUS52111 [Hexamita inflata]
MYKFFILFSTQIRPYKRTGKKCLLIPKITSFKTLNFLYGPLLDAMTNQYYTWVKCRKLLQEKIKMATESLNLVTNYSISINTLQQLKITQYHFSLFTTQYQGVAKSVKRGDSLGNLVFQVIIIRGLRFTRRLRLAPKEPGETQRPGARRPSIFSSLLGDQLEWKMPVQFIVQVHYELFLVICYFIMANTQFTEFIFYQVVFLCSLIIYQRLNII